MRSKKSFLALLVAVLANAAVFAQDSVSVKEEVVTLPTYEIGPADLNPLYFTGRVYQGAQGRAYPYAMYDILTNNKVDKDYRGLYLENEYLKICVVPDLGGRILQATDKTNAYEFFYRQHVVKPALIGMIGAWISGGVEWNIPHHHRPSTFMPIDWSTASEPDGTKVVYVGETELRHRMKWSVALKVHPGKSLLEADVSIMNRLNLAQSALSWANVSVHCNEDYQVIFPPSVQHGSGHAKIDFVDWPINNGIDYSMWKNHTDQFRSVFAWDFKDNFLAGYDHGREAGTVHVANRHEVGGKKFFLWGNHDRARMWDQMLTDDDGQYLELMVGAYSDNQPDYSWIAPGEVRSFKHFWFPISGIKHVKSANLNGALNLAREGDTKFFVGYCLTSRYEGAKATLTAQGKEVWSKTLDVAPGAPLTESVDVPAGIADSEFRLTIADANGRELIAWSPLVLDKEPTPEPVKTAGDPKECKTIEELYLAGLRLEQFHNAQIDPMIYYNEALERDPSDARVNAAVGLRLLRQGKWSEAASRLETAVARLGHNYTVLKDGEPHYYLGLAYRNLGRTQDAVDQLWKATWTTSFQAPAFFELAELAAAAGDLDEALELVERSLDSNRKNTKALSFKAWCLRRLGDKDAATAIVDDVLKRDPLDVAAALEKSFLNKGDASELGAIDARRGADLIRFQELLEVVAAYENRGAWDDALTVLNEAIRVGKPYADNPTVRYYLGYCLLRSGDEAAAKEAFAAASAMSSDYFFPFRVEERALFDAILALEPNDAQARYAYGNLLYYLEDHEKAVEQWKESARIRPEFGRVWRNLGFAANRAGDAEDALKYYETSLKADPTDPRVFAEADVVAAGLGLPAQERVKTMEARLDTAFKHDDSVVRLIGLYNETNQCDKALEILEKRHFHVWEGGRAIHDLFVDAHLVRGLRNRDAGRFDEAIADFEAAQTYPANLEVGRTNDGGQNAKVFYLLSTVYAKTNQPEKEKEALQKSIAQENLPTREASELTFYRVQAFRKLGMTAEADKALADYKVAVAAQEKGLSEINEFSKFGEEGTLIERAALVDFHKGLCALASGDLEERDRCFENALKRNPNLIWPSIVRQENWDDEKPTNGALASRRAVLFATVETNQKSNANPKQENNAMKRRFLAFLSIVLYFSGTFLFADEAERTRLWPDLAPGETVSEPAVESEPGTTAKLTCPELAWIRPEEKRGDAAMLVLLGGAYEILIDGPKGAQIVNYWKSKGFEVFVLYYRVPRPKDGRPIYGPAWQDAQRAIRTIRANAARFQIDPNKIGVVGFSAGGNLALLCALNGRTPAYAPVDELDQTPFHVNFAIAVYPAYVLDDGEFGPNARRGVDAKILDCFRFDDPIPPLCLFHGDADVYSALGSVEIYREARRRGASCELRVYANAPHGFANWADMSNASSWKESAVAWLRTEGFLP